MKRFALFAVLATLLSLLATGCTRLSTGSPDLLATSTGNDSARLQLQPNPKGNYSYLTQLDGLPTGRAAGNTEIPLEPGEHSLAVALSASPYHGLAQLSFTAEANRLYKIRTMQHGLGFRVRIWDETHGRADRYLIAETLVSGNGAAVANNVNGHYSEAANPNYQMPTEPAWVTSQIHQSTQQRLDRAGSKP